MWRGNLGGDLREDFGGMGHGFDIVCCRFNFVILSWCATILSAFPKLRSLVNWGRMNAYAGRLISQQESPYQYVWVTFPWTHGGLS